MLWLPCYNTLMCGRIVQLPLQFPDLLPWAGLSGQLASIKPRYNLAPTQRTALILKDDDQVAVRHLRWGLAPHWLKDLGAAASMTNARIETVDTKPAYRAAFKVRRCVIPMRGYYEWKKTPTGKQPYFHKLRGGGDLFAAGLWEPRHPLMEPDEAGSCTMITTVAEGAAATLHDRMPVFIPPNLVDEYLRAAPADAMALMMALPPPDLVLHPVSKRVNSTRGGGEDDPSLLDPVDLPPSA